MKQIFWTLGRLLLITSTSLSLAIIASLPSYQSYWHKTIKRVQTVDFNILFHTLPTKLSYALINQDIEELQRTLNSNYGLFGIVVTDCLSNEPECPNQKIIYSSESNFSWKQQLDSKTLSNSPYSTLQNPPPLWAEGGFDNPRDETWKLTGKTNQGKIIGRVYYLRGIPPTFSADLKDWIEKFPSSLITSSGADKYYTLTFGVFFMGGLVIVLLIERILLNKRIANEKQQRLLKEKEQAVFEAKQLQQKLTKRQQEISTLITQREEILNKSEKIQEKTQQQAQQLKDEINQLKKTQQKYQKELEIEQQNKAKIESRLQAQKQRISELQNKQQEKVQFSEQIQEELIEAQNYLEKLEQEQLEQTEFITQLQEKNTNNEENYQQEIYLKEKTLQQTQNELIKTQENNKRQQNLLEQLKLDRKEIEQRYESLNQNFASNIEKLQQELKRVQDELIEQRNQDDYIKLLEEENNQFKQEKENIETKICELEQNISSKEYKYQSLQYQYNNLQEKIAVYRQQKVETLDLSSKTLAFIGGEQEVITRIIQDLCSDFNLQKNPIIIQPSWETRMNLCSVRLRIINADFIFHFTGRTRHDSQNILKQIKHQIPGQIIPINSNGYSGGLRDILEYLVSQQ